MEERLSCQTDCDWLFRTELNADAREVRGELYCLRCHDKMGIPICGACRRPIEERVVTALGKNWHVEVGDALLFRQPNVVNVSALCVRKMRKTD
jgi:hypothetical protein